MTDFRAMPEQWAVLQETTISCWASTILELRARVEALEALAGSPVKRVTRDRDETGDYLIIYDAARRPKPPSLKEQSLALVEQHEEGWRPSPKDWDTIRRALEALPDNTSQPS